MYSRFAADFHHTGGDTPERYGANQSNIGGTPGYGDYSNQHSAYDQYGDHRRSYDNGYRNTDGSWGGYLYKDTSYTQQPAKPGEYTAM